RRGKAFGVRMRTMTFKDAIAAGILASALALPAGTASAQDSNPVSNLVSRILGFGGGDQPAINYSERAPLGLPGNRDMPAPTSKQALIEDPNWPKDPDEQKRKKVSTDSRGPASSNTELLGPNEMAAGTRSGSASKLTAYQQDQAYEHMSNPVNPKVLA